MNGFEQIKSFYSWVFNNPDKARPTHVSLYLFLWNQNNRANWVEWFKCPYDLAMQGACIGNNGTYYKCLDELKLWGLIDYKKGINNYKAPIIKLIQLYNNEQLTVQVNEQVTVPLSEQLSEQVSGQQTVQLTEQVTVHIYKLLTNNLKRITDNLEPVIKFLDDFEKSSPLTKMIIDSYFNWFKEKTGSKPKINGAEAKAAQELGRYIKQIVNEKYPNSSNEKIIEGWVAILMSYEKWESFNQKQLKLTQINSNITNIIANIKGLIPKQNVRKPNFDDKVAEFLARNDDREKDSNGNPIETGDTIFPIRP